MSDLEYSIGQALSDGVEDYDIDAIAAALRRLGVQDVDDVPEEQFWAVVTDHALPEIEQVQPLDQFKAELEEAVRTPPNAPAIWKRGGVTLEISGHSRVNMTMPQPLASYRLAVAGGETVDLTADEVSSWSRLWETVESHLAAWTADVEVRREAYEHACVAEAAAAEAARKAASAAERARQALTAVAPVGEGRAERVTMSTDEVAEYLGIARGSVRKQMSRWGIEATYERGQNRPEARYPTAEVQAKAARRPGQGHRSDLR
ncbi:hypothetical protein [Streptomyces sp. NPDC015125]|uniref:hypothetical protein n=1 Tax=Streptomyces sp. NPDC015125 TaxID=3364938 RepID=UPI0036F959CC